MKKVLVILVSILLYSCSSGDITRTVQYDLDLDKSVILDYKKCLKIVEKEYEICLESINDSRCPTSAVCVWEGDAAIEFNLKSNSENLSFILHSNDTFQQDTVINGLIIKLLGITPFPDLNNPLEQGDYSVELSISELQE